MFYLIDKKSFFISNRNQIEFNKSIDNLINFVFQLLYNNYTIIISSIILIKIMEKKRREGRGLKMCL
jgi:hypothetical protein